MAKKVNGILVPEGTDVQSAEAIQDMASSLTDPTVGVGIGKEHEQGALDVGGDIYADDILLEEKSVASHMAESAYWIRVDTLSAPLYIGDSSYANQAIVPISVSNSADKIFAIRFANTATSSATRKQIVIIEGNMSGTGRVIDIWTEGTLRDVKPASVNNMSFYMNATEDVYIHAIYLVKDMEV